MSTINTNKFFHNWNIYTFGCIAITILVITSVCAFHSAAAFRAVVLAKYLCVHNRIVYLRCQFLNAAHLERINYICNRRILGDTLSYRIFVKVRAVVYRIPAYKAFNKLFGKRYKLFFCKNLQGCDLLVIF